MKHKNTWIRTLTIGAVILGAWWIVSRKTIIPSPSAALSAAVGADPIAIKETIRVEPNFEVTWPFSAPSGRIPGRLTGHWTCTGKSAGIRGAQDDSLVSFTLTSPDNRTIQKLNHPLNGNFDVRVDGPGVYTFTFNNAGIVRSSGREVEFEGTYQPD